MLDRLSGAFRRKTKYAAACRNGAQCAGEVFASEDAGAAMRTHASGPGRFRMLARAYARAASEAVAETLWPARCAVCGKMGDVLCADCLGSLPFIDQWRACPRCGSPYGMNQCTDCNSFSLRGLGRTSLPFAACVSAVAFTDGTARIVRLRKDQGDRALARPMAFVMACAVPPSWTEGACVVPVPSTRRALRRRGFCHGMDLARETAEMLGLPSCGFLSARSARDQRELGRRARAENTAGRFVADACAQGRRVIVVDDVYTTGSTIAAAADALVAAGAREVFALTFARA